MLISGSSFFFVVESVFIALGVSEVIVTLVPASISTSPAVAPILTSAAPVIATLLVVALIATPVAPVNSAFAPASISTSPAVAPILTN